MPPFYPRRFRLFQRGQKLLLSLMDNNYASYESLLHYVIKHAERIGAAFCISITVLFFRNL